MHGIARKNDHCCSRNDDACENIERNKLDHDGSPLTIGCIGGKVRGNCPFPLRAVFEELGLVIEQFLTRFCCEFEVRTFDNRINRSSLLTKSAVNALGHIDVIARGPAAAVIAWFRFDGNGQGRTHRLT